MEKPHDLERIFNNNGIIMFCKPFNNYIHISNNVHAFLFIYI